MAEHNLGGLGKPKIVFNDGSFVLLPEPNGINRDGIEVYDFDESVLARYRSEGNKEVTIGKKEIFTANLRWITLTKYYYFKLLQAQSQGYFKFILNDDYPDVYFNCRCRVRGKFIAGLINDPSGYSVDLQLRGIDYKDSSYLGPLAEGSGYGTSYGLDSGNQSP